MGRVKLSLLANLHPDKLSAEYVGLFTEGHEILQGQETFTREDFC